MQPKTIQTSRLLLRPFTEDDADAYFPLVSDPTVLKYTGEGPVQAIEDARQILLTRPIRDYATHGFGRMAVIERASQRLIGFCGLKYLPELREVDIGYRFVPDNWGQGYATESARAIMAEASTALQLKKVIGLAYPENAASINVLVKLGLGFEKNIRLDGVPSELVWYSVSWQ